MCKSGVVVPLSFPTFLSGEGVVLEPGLDGVGTSSHTRNTHELMHGVGEGLSRHLPRLFYRHARSGNVPEDLDPLRYGGVGGPHRTGGLGEVTTDEAT